MPDTKWDLLERLEKLMDEEGLSALIAGLEMDDPTTYGLNELEQIASLATVPAFQVLSERIERNRENWTQKFAKGLLDSQNLVDQREVDYRRGYWRAARYYTRYLPLIAADQVARAAETKDGE